MKKSMEVNCSGGGALPTLPSFLYATAPLGKGQIYFHDWIGIAILSLRYRK